MSSRWEDNIKTDLREGSFEFGRWLNLRFLTIKESSKNMHLPRLSKWEVRKGLSQQVPKINPQIATMSTRGEDNIKTDLRRDLFSLRDG
jgi:hypothetical protein